MLLVFAVGQTVREISAKEYFLLGVVSSWLEGATCVSGGIVPDGRGNLCCGWYPDGWKGQHVLRVVSSRMEGATGNAGGIQMVGRGMMRCGWYPDGWKGQFWFLP